MLSASTVACVLAFGGCGDDAKSPTAPPSGPVFAAASGGSLGVNLDQCANKPRTSTCAWQNGDLNGNNSTYAEGLVIPFRLAIDGLTPGTHSFHINYDFTAGGEEGDDFLADFDATELVDVCAAGGGGRSQLCDQAGGIGAGSQVTFPSDPFRVPGTLQSGSPLADLSVAGAEGSSLFGVNNKRHLRIWGGTITSITPAAGPVHSGPTSGNSSADFVVTFNATGSSVAFAWGAHLSQSSYWKNADGTPDGAGQISGAPWHMRTQQLDASGNKNQDRSIQPSAIIHPPQVSLTKTADAASVNAGSQIGFTITATNTGAGDATSFLLSDPLPAGSGITWSIASQSGSPTCAISSGTLLCPSSGTGTLAAGATLTVHITSPTTSASCGTYQNTATVSFSTATGGIAPPPAQASVTVNCASIGLTKVADASPVNAGDAIGFTITATNSGAGTATGVTVTDNLPTGTGLSWSISPSVSGCSISSGVLTCNFGSLAPAATASVHITSSTTFASCATVSNTANVTTTNDGSAQASAQVVVNCPDLQISKTADAATVNAGSAIGFSITVNNAGAGTAKSATLSDALPTGTGISWSISPTYAGPGSCSITTGTLSCSFGDLAAGASATVHVTSSTSSASCKAYSNTATAQATNHAQVTASASTTVQCPSLSITKTPAAQTVSAGDPFSWTVTLTNDGPGTALAARISDPLPSVTGVSYTLGSSSPSGASCAISSGTLSCGPLDLAANATITAVVNATSSANQGCVSGGFTNTATGSATGVSNVTATARTTLNCPHLTISKTPDVSGDAGYNVQPGGTASFSITVSNTGAGSAFHVVLTDTLPAGLSWSESKAECAIDQVSVSSVTRDRVICTIGTLAAGASYSVTVSATVPSGILLQPPSAAGTPIEIDGNLVDDAALGKDWATVGINCTSSPKVGCDLDRPTGSNDDSFGQGTKEDTPVPTVVTGSIPNNKSDLLRFYVASERFVTTDFLDLAWERVQAPNGTTNMDFELNQSSVISANGETPVRTAGDILIKYDLAKGGTVPTLGFHRWITTGSSSQCEASNAVPCWGKATALTTDVFAAINLSGVTDPLNPGAPRSLDALTFGEARINLQASGIFQSGVCTNFGQAYLKSRSSDSFSSEIKDFIAPIPISVSNCAPVLLNNKAWTEADGVSPIFDTGQISVTETATALLIGAPSGALFARSNVTGSATPVTVAVLAVEPFSSPASREAARSRTSRSDVASRRRGDAGDRGSAPRSRSRSAGVGDDAAEVT